MTIRTAAEMCCMGWLRDNHDDGPGATIKERRNEMYFKSNDAVLCTDCDIIFSANNQDDHHPVCPICCNKNVLNVGNVLNRTTMEQLIQRRKEARDEKADTIVLDNRIGLAVHNADDRLVREDPSCGVSSNGGSGNSVVRRCCLESWDGEAESKDNQSNADCRGADGTVKTVFALLDVVRKLLQTERCIKSELPRINAGSIIRVL